VDFHKFLCEVIHLKQCGGGADADEFWQNAPPIRPYTKVTKVNIGGTLHSSPPQCLAEVHSHQLKKLTESAAKEVNTATKERSITPE
jgi:hypothetical protein